MNPFYKLFSRPLMSRLLPGWALLTLAFVLAAVQFSSWHRGNVGEDLLSERGYLHARVASIVFRYEALASRLAADETLRSLLARRGDDCADDCLSANSFRLVARLNELVGNRVEHGSLFVWTGDGTIGGSSRVNLPPALTTAMSREGNGWIRPVPPATTLGGKAPAQEVSVYFFGKILADAWLVLEVDAYELTADMLATRDLRSDAYLFDPIGILISRPAKTDVLVTAGVLPNPWPILNVSLRDPGSDLKQGRATLPRSSQPLVHAVKSALQSPLGLTLDSYRNYVGQQVVGAWRFDADLGVGVVVEFSASSLNRPIWIAWGLAALASVLVLVGFWTLSHSVARREASVHADVERLDSLLGEARDEIEGEVSRRNQAFDDYARSEQSLRALLQAFPHGVLMFGAGGELLMANRQFRHQWGVTAGEDDESAVFGAMAAQLGKQLDELENVLLREDVPPFLSLENGRKVTVESWPASLDQTQPGRFLVFRDAEDATGESALGRYFAAQLNLPMALVSTAGEVRLTTPDFDAFFGESDESSPSGTIQSGTIQSGTIQSGTIHDVIHPGSDCPGGSDCSLLGDSDPVGQLSETSTVYRVRVGDEFIIGVAPTAEIFVESKHRRLPGVLHPSHVGWHLQKLWCLQLLSRSTNHDFNNRISAIYGYSDLAEMSVGDTDQIKESVDEIRNASEQGQILVQSYMSFARSLVGDRTEIEAGELVQSAMQLGLLIKPFSIEADADIQAAGAALSTYPNLIQQVLVVHLLEAVSDLEDVGGSISVRLADEDGLKVYIVARANETIARPSWREPERRFNQSTARSVLAFLGASQSRSDDDLGWTVEVLLPGQIKSGDVILLIGPPAWSEPLGENLERNGRAVLTIDDVDTARSLFDNQAHMFGGVVFEESIDAASLASFEQFARTRAATISIVRSSVEDTATDVIARLL